MAPASHALEILRRVQIFGGLTVEVAFKTNGDGTTAPLTGAETEISAARAELVNNAMLQNKSNKV